MKRFNIASLIILIFSMSFTVVMAEEEKESGEKAEKKEKKDKNMEFKLEGVITKGKKGMLILKTDMDEIKLPPVPADNTTLKYEDFLEKKVILIGTGHMVKDKINANFPDRHVLKTVKEIKLFEEKPAEPQK